MNNTIEILAPAGSLEALKAAISSGADAVYFGGNKYSARKNAVNLSDDEIAEAVRYAHLRHASLYVTVNTLAFDSELEGVFEFLKFCYKSGVDGVIVQDFGVISLMKKFFPNFRIHASTQMTIHNLAGAIMAEKMGFDRVVLARELSFDNIKYIADNCNVELEVFVHGALCMSYSGQCLLSSFLGGRSGNRGACAQPCRLAYSLTDKNSNLISEKNKYLLSLKDLCLIDKIGELKKIGVKSLKIEGRMKSAAYVSAVSGIYNKYRDGEKVLDEDRQLLADIFSRSGFTDGYYKSQTGRNMLNYSENNDKIYSKVTSDVVSKANDFACIDKKTSVEAEFSVRLGEKGILKMSYDNKTFVAQTESEAVLAEKKSIDETRIREQLEKLGGTVFEYSSLSVSVDDGIFISIKEVNAIRRDVILQIEEYILGKDREYEPSSFNLIKPENKRERHAIYTASVLTQAQADAAYDAGFEKIYIPYSVYKSNKERYDSDCDVFCVKLPPINHDGYANDFSDIETEEICITNIGQLYRVKNGKKLHADYRMNIYNSLSIRYLAKLGISSFCYSPELTIKQIEDTSATIPSEIVVYGKISLMTLRNCVVKSATEKCVCSENDMYYLRDRKNIEFPVFTQKGECINTIYNSAPIVMSDRMKELENCGASMYRFDFTDESPDDIPTILDNYENGVHAEGFFTRGHFYNGVQ